MDELLEYILQAQKENGLSNKEIDLNFCKSIHGIIVYDRAIQDMELIKYFENLEYLNCSNNFIESIDLSNNVNLKYLYINNNYLEHLNLEKNINLVQLSCINNAANMSVVLSNEVNLKGHVADSVVRNATKYVNSKKRGKSR